MTTIAPGSILDTLNEVSTTQDTQTTILNTIASASLPDKETPTTPAWTPLKNTTYKIGSKYGSAGQRNFLNGTAGTNVAFDGSINSSTNMKIGGYGSGTTYNFGGSIKNLRIYKKALSNSAITNLTTT